MLEKHGKSLKGAVHNPHGLQLSLVEAAWQLNFPFYSVLLSSFPRVVDPKGTP